MPVDLKEKLIGRAGVAQLLNYTHPRFLYASVSDVEDLFVRYLRRKFQEFKLNGEFTDIPEVIPAYSAWTDRKFHVVVVEATMNNIYNRGLGAGAEIQVQPDPNDSNVVWTYRGRTGDVSFSVDIYVRSPSRLGAAIIADWVVAALMDPLGERELSENGIQIPYDKVRGSGKVTPTKEPGADPKGGTTIWTAMLSIPDIILPWARLYRMDGPSIEEIIAIVNDVQRSDGEDVYQAVVLPGTVGAYLSIADDGTQGSPARPFDIGSTDFMIETRIRSSYSGEYGFVFGKQDGYNVNGWGTFIHTDGEHDGNLCILLKGTAGSSMFSSALSIASPTDFHHCHILVSLSDAKVRFYIDGLLDITHDLPDLGDLDTDSNVLCGGNYGEYPDGILNWLSAHIDFIRMYKFPNGIADVGLSTIETGISAGVASPKNPDTTLDNYLVNRWEFNGSVEAYEGDAQGFEAHNVDQFINI